MNKRKRVRILTFLLFITAILTACTLELPMTGSSGSTQVQAPRIDVPASDVVTGAVVLTGTGQPNATVEVLADGVVLGETTVGADGTWSFEVELPQAGDFFLVARSYVEDGMVVEAESPVLVPVQFPLG